MKNEIWRPVPGHPNYEVSSLGQVRSVDHFVPSRGGGLRPVKGRVLKTFIMLGYFYTRLGSGTNQIGIHRLVCEAFHGPCPPDHVVAHSDGNKQNNTPDNLRWATYAENEADKSLHGTKYQGEAHHQAKLSIDDVLLIRSSLENNTNLAKQFDVSKALIGMVRKRRIWKHV